jgi:4-diphosphocytidyl-2-C-methyl-D-erythritol kinase
VTAPGAAVAAQAKVNLFLRVLAREASGYHQLETLFCRLVLADDVVVRVRSGWTLDCRGADTGPAEANLAYRAAKLYASERQWPAGCAITIDKRIPVGGGLGGGSADAGAVLRCLHALDPHPPPAAALLEWGGRLGADVPALTLAAPLALGYGRGDQLLTLPALPVRPVMLYVPATRVATRDAYEWLAESRDGTAGGGTATARAIDIRDLARWESLVPLMANDFAPVVGARHPEIVRATAELRAMPGACASLMSGSGSTVFGVFDGALPEPWPLAAPPGAALVATTTADHVFGVRRVD